MTTSLKQTENPQRGIRALVDRIKGVLRRDYMSELRRLYIECSDVTHAYLHGMDLVGADFGYADMTYADLSNADCSGADFNHAELSCAYLKGVMLIGADLTSADLSTATLTDADLTSANLSDADLSGSGLVDANLTDTNLTGVHVNWQSHDLLSEIVRRAANEETDSSLRAEKLKVADTILGHRKWCWAEFLALHDPLQGWVLQTLAMFIKEDDDLPDSLRLLTVKTREKE